MRIQVVVRLQFEGVHCWPECDLPGVEFLRSPHRHIFHVEARRLVEHSDRDVEIILLKRAMEKFCREMYRDAGRKSCEDMAMELIAAFDLASCQVLEDGENGAYVEP